MRPQRPLRLISLSHHATSTRLVTISSEHFRVTYPADVDRRDANQVLAYTRIDAQRFLSTHVVGIHISRYSDPGNST